MGDAISTCRGGAFTKEANQPHCCGQWVTSKGNVHSVGLEAIQWSNGDLSPFVIQRRWGKLPTCATNVRGKRFTGELRPDDTLAWSDGDLWVRDTRRAETHTKEVLAQVSHSLVESVFRRFQRNTFAIPVLRMQGT